GHTEDRSRTQTFDRPRPEAIDRQRPPTIDRSRTIASSTPQKSGNIPYAINAFSFKLDSVLSKSNDNKNVFYSPVGIVYAFSMLMLGASDESELEVFRGLHLNEVFKTPDDAHKAFRGLLKILESNANYSLDLANIILIQQNEHFLKDYTKRLGNFYKVAIGEVDFLKNGRKVMKDINEWVARNTHNQIKDLLKSPLDPLTRLVIVNAVYFKGRWRIGFDKEDTSNKEFFNYGRKPKKMPFMHSINKYGYYENKEKNYQMLELKYVGDVSFVIILPKEKRGLDELLENFDISEIDKPLEEVKVQISLPRINLATEYDLKKVLPELGIKAIFGPGANLSGINGDKTLFVLELLSNILARIKNEKSFQFELNQGVFVDKNVAVSEKLKQAVKEKFDAIISQVDFTDVSISNNINKWISSQTNNRFNEVIFDRLNEQTKLVSVSTAYFKGVWKTKFVPTKITRFDITDKKQINVPFLNKQSTYRLFRNRKKQYRLLELDYEGNLTFAIILPYKRVGLKTVLKRLTIDDFTAYAASNRKYDLFMPKLKLERKYELGEVLSKLGMNSLFGSGEFAGLMIQKESPVTKIFHDTMIEVDEYGTADEPAAENFLLSKKYIPKFIVNRPFLFFIRNNNNNLIYFIACINNP
ncbi:Serpin B8-like protein, partial [Leptotrombidium deliense]